MKSLPLLLTLTLTSCAISTLPNENMDYIDEIKSDCKSWLVANVREDGKIKSISLFNYNHIPDLKALHDKLITVNINKSLMALRYKRIADRRGERVLSEHEIVRQFIAAALELTNE